MKTMIIRKISTAGNLIASLVFVMLSCTPPARVAELPAAWPTISPETKPWTRWWWHGSSVTKQGITAELEALQRAGIGGVEITPIYGVYGEEDKFIRFLSPQWVEMVGHVLQEAKRLDLGVDLATGTGWPFGGPWVDGKDACKNLQFRIYDVAGGSKLREKITFIQPAYLRLVGNNIYKPSSAGAMVRVFDTNRVSVKDIKDPVSLNTNLQQLAIDQIQFEKPLRLVTLMAYGPGSRVEDLTSRVDPRGYLDWTAPAGNWKLCAVFEGFHGKMVERAGPGGEGNVIDHFSDSALANYLAPFDKALNGHDITPLRAFFNDSYEVDDARGAADFTPALFTEFRDRRGYDLRHHLPALFGKDSVEKNERVLCDYRETLSDLLLEKFTERWRQWAHSKDALVRNQAHGSPSNILDLYAAVDIPEIEGIEPLRFKMASSSGNISGKRLVAAEAGTWLNEHFESSLGDIRQALDEFMLHGVNHLVYHGTCYSPQDEPWPGRLFYAAVQLNSRNPQWKDFHALNAYVARCQSFLQDTSPDNDVLLYYPIYDRFSSPGPEMVEHFDGIGGFKGSSFERVAEEMLKSGFAFDYISDKQLRAAKPVDNFVTTSGGGKYRAIVVPACRYMPLETLRTLRALAEHVPVIFAEDMPASVSGYHDLDNNGKEFDELKNQLRNKCDVSENILASLVKSGVRQETMFESGIEALRKKDTEGNAFYFVKNKTMEPYEGWLPLSSEMDGVNMYDPMDGRSGMARSRASDGGIEVFVQLAASQTVILTDARGREARAFPYREGAGSPIVLTGTWRVAFESGGPVLPGAFESDSLIFWTNLKDQAYQDFSGTATYVLTFDRPKMEASRWLLKLDSVQSTAEVILNGQTIGTLLGPVFEVEFDGSLLKDQNLLELKVANLMANRIAWMDRNKLFWKKFYNINFAARRRENAKNGIFDASDWKPRPSGAAGVAQLIALE